MGYVLTTLRTDLYNSTYLIRGVRLVLYLAGRLTLQTPPFTIQHLFGRPSHFFCMGRSIVGLYG